MSRIRPTPARATRNAPHKIRIIGGRYKRTPIPILDLPGLRPTPDRVRETLYNWINHLWDGEFAGRTVLDVFAGSGALGLEAASRGVERAVLIESDRQAASALQALRTKLDAGNVEVITGDARSALARLAGSRFDLVLLDPPFGEDWITRILPAVMQVLTNDGLLYIEAEQPLEAPPGLELLRHDRAGAVHFHLLRVGP
jgi:16S rRNA (guanine(966)-N(2))-methyltransferase RsmD